MILEWDVSHFVVLCSRHIDFDCLSSGGPLELCGIPDERGRCNEPFWALLGGVPFELRGKWMNMTVALYVSSVPHSHPPSFLDDVI